MEKDTKNTYSVYVHINKKNNKKYVGITSIDPICRWENGHGYHQQMFGNAINKYGWDAFEHIILNTGLTKEEACKKEKYYIDLWKTNNKNYGYNIQNGGVSYGKHSNETKNKLRETNIGSNNKKSKKINQYTLEGKFIKTWDAIRDAERELNIPATLISCCCKGKYKTVHGFIWRYASEYDARKDISVDYLRNGNSRAVNQYDKDGNFIKKWESMTEVYNKLNISVGNISMVCQKKQLTAGGYKWEYA